MKLSDNYKKLGPYIREIDIRNKDLSVNKLLGVSNEKYFIPSIANIIGTDLSNYKIVKKNQFAFGTVTSRNGDKISIAILKEAECIVSSSYVVFEVVDENELNPDYLMMWLRREEFDRYARFMSHGSVRELFGWDKMCDIELPIPDIDTQLRFVNDYSIIQESIKIKEAINNNLLEQMRIMSIERNRVFDKKIKISDTFNVFTGKKDVNQAKTQGKYRFYSCSPDFLYSDDYICDKESILISGNGSYTGRVSIAKAPFDLYQRTYALTPIQEGNFIYYTFAILSSLFKNKVESSLHGSAIPYIVLNDITNFEIPVNSYLINADLSFCKSAVSIFKANIEEILCLNKLKMNILTQISQQ